MNKHTRKYSFSKKSRIFRNLIETGCGCLNKVNGKYAGTNKRTYSVLICVMQCKYRYQLKNLQCYLTQLMKLQKNNKTLESWKVKRKCKRNYVVYENYYNLHGYGISSYLQKIFASKKTVGLITADFHIKMI